MNKVYEAFATQSDGKKRCRVVVDEGHLMVRVMQGSGPLIEKVKKVKRNLFGKNSYTSYFTFREHLKFSFVTVKTAADRWLQNQHTLLITSSRSKTTPAG
jgi:hypothetical protein